MIARKNSNIRKGIKEMRPAQNYLWCLVPGKGILKGRGKKESFYHVLQELWEAICQYSVSLPAVLLLLFSPRLLEPSTWKEVFSSGFVSLGNSTFVVKATGPEQWNSAAESTSEEVSELLLVWTVLLWSTTSIYSLNTQVLHPKPLESISLNKKKQHTE